MPGSEATVSDDGTPTVGACCWALGGTGLQRECSGGSRQTRLSLSRQAAGGSLGRCKGGQQGLGLSTHAVCM